MFLLQDEKNQVLTTNICLEQVRFCFKSICKKIPVVSFFKEWYDQRLVWNASEFNGLSTLRLPCSKIWLPADTFFIIQLMIILKVIIKVKRWLSNGYVFWPPPAKFRSSCKIDVTFFPFDGKENVF